ncbi:MAG: hypothetical protein KGI68_12195 [Alphaproteobacteria bacterium]|nr:hypothetical protein [Alphaproteobacteria bacterium]MDE1939774.1 hypothetical protein [Alphaproteobacteria bacterium]MDE2011465.1 hypothetical protein [Alphaproteobacteria bacterium]MDE2071856.1 hypothetical protein [Alphaproteobacteria bacterium]MDE2350471.1 hypothetical protein [Alphaproteobacteria bacterium]
MSNSFEALGAGDIRPGAEHAPLIRLLLAMAGEWAAIAGDISTLGAHVARAAADRHNPVSIRDLQSFDTIGQRAHAQAELLTKLACKIAADPALAPAHLPELLAHIPFEEVRANLKAACHGASPDQQEPSLPADDAVDWF